MTDFHVHVEPRTTKRSSTPAMSSIGAPRHEPAMSCIPAPERNSPAMSCIAPPAPPVLSAPAFATTADRAA